MSFDLTGASTTPLAVIVMLTTPFAATTAIAAIGTTTAIAVILINVDLTGASTCQVLFKFMR
jgi:hypothetical protein